MILNRSKIGKHEYRRNDFRSEFPPIAEGCVAAESSLVQSAFLAYTKLSAVAGSPLRISVQ
jgi:hypothetical protein